MARVTPQEYAQNWYQGLTGSTDKIAKGIQRVTVSPAEKAIAAQAKMLANLQQAVTSGKWAAGLRKTTLASWQDAAIKKGIPRIQNGATEAQPKVAEMANKLLPFIDAAVAKINQMPKNTLQDSANRASAFVLEMGKYRG